VPSQRRVGTLVERLGARFRIGWQNPERPYNRERACALHVVSAWASEHRLVLGQVKVSEKSNEITAIFIGGVNLSGCTIDD